MATKTKQQELYYFDLPYTHTPIQYISSLYSIYTFFSLLFLFDIIDRKRRKKSLSDWAVFVNP